MRLLGLGRSTKRALVLGCGPAGLFAAHALVGNGWAVEIYSKSRKSHMFGAQYLHAPIPGLTQEDAEPVNLTYRLTGDLDGYRQKVYGLNEVATSPELLDKEHLAWDIREAYDAAWERYGPLVNDKQVTPEFLGMHNFSDASAESWKSDQLVMGAFDLVVNTIPLPALCYQRHQFHSVMVWAMGDAPSHGQYVPYRPRPNTVECNGLPDTGWYRAANVFDHATMEWPWGKKPPLPGVAEVTKPLYSTCDCYQHEYPVPFINLGRYGAWRKGILSHHAYTSAAAL